MSDLALAKRRVDAEERPRAVGLPAPLAAPAPPAPAATPATPAPQASPAPEPSGPPASGTSSAAAHRSAAARLLRRDLVVYLLIALVVASAWQVSSRGLIKPHEPLGYWIGVAGATMMALLFLYPLRKYTRWMRRVGSVKGWFWFHLAMGIGGPWLVLLHSGFHAGSLNAAVALTSMGVVVASGVVGRFLYVRLHRSLDDERAALQALRRRVGLEGGDEALGLHYAPAVLARLAEFEARGLQRGGGWLGDLGRVFGLPLARRVAFARCRRELELPLRARAAARHWRAEDLRRRRRRAHRLVDDHLTAVLRVAQTQAYARLFALWHHAHLPFIYLLVISAVVHVVAVHAY